MFDPLPGAEDTNYTLETQNKERESRHSAGNLDPTNYLSGLWSFIGMLPENENDPQSHPSVKPMSYNDWPDDMTGATPSRMLWEQQLLSDYI